MSCLFGSRFDLHQALRDAQTAHRLCCRHQGKRQQGSERELLAKKFFRKLLKGLQYVPRVMITDKLKSYGAAKRDILPGVDHRQSRSLNNRCEHSHRPTRQREYRMQGFKSAGHDQRFLSAYGPIAQHFRPRRHWLSVVEYREEMRSRFESWAEITGTERAA